MKLQSHRCLWKRFFLWSLNISLFQYASAMQPDHPRYVIDRPAYNLPDFDRAFDRKSRQFPVGEKVKKVFRYRTRHSYTAQSTLAASLPASYPGLHLWQPQCCDQTLAVPCSHGSIQTLDPSYGLFKQQNAAFQRVSPVCMCQMFCAETEGFVTAAPARAELAAQVQSQRQLAVWCHQRGQRRHHSGSPRSVSALLQSNASCWLQYETCVCMCVC